jgi:hypothetical protein
MVEVKFHVDAVDHADAVRVINEAVRTFNVKASDERKSQRMEIDELSVARWEGKRR